jgi:hypothetical protein
VVSGQHCRAKSLCFFLEKLELVISLNGIEHKRFLKANSVIINLPLELTLILGFEFNKKYICSIFSIWSMGTMRNTNELTSSGLCQRLTL